MVKPGTHFRKEMPIQQYISEKIDMLKNEFYVRLTDEEELHMNSLKYEYEVDAYARKLLVNKL